MASAAAKMRMYTFDDFCEIIRDDQKADLIDGVIYMASPDNTDANDLFMWMGGLVYDYCEYFDLGKVFGSRVAYKLDEHSSPEPDIGFVRKKRVQRVKRGHVRGRPDAAMEIVSPESVERDYGSKRTKYESAGVPEYWILDELQHTVTLLRLDASGKYREVKPRQGKLLSKVMPGFYIRPEWLWPATRPMKVHALAELIGKQKK